MAFSYASKSQSIAGSIKIETISFNAASVTTGDLYAHMSHIDSVIICNETSGAVANQKAVISGNKITLSGLTSSDVGSVVVIGH